MPRFRRTFRKKRFARRRSFTRRSSTRNGGSFAYGRSRMGSKKGLSLLTFKGNQVPDSIAITFKNQSYFRSSNGPGVASMFNFFIANALGNPWQIANSNPPMGYTQWGSFYQRYRVMASAIKVRITGLDYLGDNAQIRSQFGRIGMSINPMPHGQAYTSGPQALEAPYTKKILVSVTDTSSNANTLSHYMTTPKVEGLTRQQVVTESDYAALFVPSTSRPLLLWYWALAFTNLPSLPANTVIVNYSVDITQYCVAFDRALIPLSAVITEGDIEAQAAEDAVETASGVREDPIAPASFGTTTFEVNDGSTIEPPLLAAMSAAMRSRAKPAIALTADVEADADVTPDDFTDSVEALAQLSDAQELPEEKLASKPKPAILKQAVKKSLIAKKTKLFD